MINNEKLLYEVIFNTIPFGLILLDQERTILGWNQWMENHMKISAGEVLGKSLNSIYQVTLNFRFNWALTQVLDYGHPQILSSTLNEFVFPIPIEKGPFGDLDKMQQEIQILPINYEDKNLALIVIKDVSAKVHLKNTLMSIAAKFEQSSFIDMLTGCYNRRFLFKYLDAELSTAKSQGYNVICCLYDLDYFKKINDEFGHEAGDEALVLFAKLAKSVLPNDYFFRYGGEEFIAIITQIDLKTALMMLNRIRTQLEKTQLRAVSKKVTCSGGVSYWTSQDKPLTAEKLINLADIQLYKAKTKGRNCIIMDGHEVQNTP